MNTIICITGLLFVWGCAGSWQLSILPYRRSKGKSTGHIFAAIPMGLVSGFLMYLAGIDYPLFGFVVGMLAIYFLIWMYFGDKATNLYESIINFTWQLAIVIQIATYIVLFGWDHKSWKFPIGFCCTSAIIVFLMSWQSMKSLCCKKKIIEN